MQLGMIGLGRMGGNMIRRVMAAGHEGVVHDLDPAHPAPRRRGGQWRALARRPRGAAATTPRGLDDGPSRRPDRGDGAGARRAAGAGRRRHRRRQLLLQGQRATRPRARPKGIQWLDVGTSGGVWGLERGYCLMIGGPDEAVERLDSVFATIAPGIDGAPTTPDGRATPPRRRTAICTAGLRGQGTKRPSCPRTTTCRCSRSVPRRRARPPSSWRPAP